MSTGVLRSLPFMKGVGFVFGDNLSEFQSLYLENRLKTNFCLRKVGLTPISKSKMAAPRGFKKEEGKPLIGRHGGSVVSTVASQQEGSEFESRSLRGLQGPS